MIDVLNKVCDLRLVWVVMATYFAIQATQQQQRKLFLFAIAGITGICAVGYASLAEPDHSRMWQTIIGLLTVCSPVIVGWDLYTTRKRNRTPQAESLDLMTSVRKMVRRYPKGKLLVNRQTRRIEECSRAFAKKIGLLLPDDVIARIADEFTQDPDGHAAKVEGVKGDIENRPVVLKDVDGNDLPAQLSVTLLSDIWAVVYVDWKDE